MKKIAAMIFQGSNYKICKRDNTFEIFGIDFMIDDEYKVWLIEVNKSPALEYSTVTT
jgi:tubulin monoglycylase TTLL3/8